MNEKMDCQCGWVKVYHPSGLQVTIPVTVGVTPEFSKGLFDSVSAILASGFLVSAPGADEGETVEEIGWIVKREKVNSDGSTTPVVDLYPTRGQFRILGVYLNDAALVNEFQDATGCKLADLPLYEGDNSIERGKNPKLDKYVHQLKTPAKVAWKNNPRWEGDEDKKHSKRLFSKWMYTPSTTAKPEPQQAMPSRSYADGTEVGISDDAKINDAEIKWFDKHVKVTGNVPASVNALRSWKSLQMQAQLEK